MIQPKPGSQIKFGMTQETRYEIRVSTKARGLRLSVHADGKIVVTKPFFTPEILVSQFVNKHQDWIEKQLEHLKKHPAPLLGKLSVKDYKAHKELARALEMFFMKEEGILTVEKSRAHEIANKITGVVPRDRRGHQQEVKVPDIQ